MQKLAKIWDFISQIGSSSNINENNNKKIILTNQVAMVLLLLSLMGFCYSIIDQNPVRTISYLIVIFIIPISFFLNYVDKKDFARVLLSFFLSLVVILPPLILGGQSIEYAPNFFYLILALGFLPILLFDSKEEIKTICIGIIYYFVVIFFYDKIVFASSNNIKQIVGMDFILYKTPQLLLFSILSFVLFFAQYINKISEIKVMNLLEELKSKNIENQSLVEEITTQNEELMSQQEAIYAQNDKLQTINEEMLNINDSLDEHNNILKFLVKNQNLKNGNFEDIAIEITKIIFQKMEIDRVGVWKIDDKNKTINCMCLNINGIINTETNIKLLELEFPNYIKALKEEKIVVAENAITNPKTSEFVEVYLNPLGIKSLLDVPFFIDGELAGIICCEHLSYKKWNLYEMSFLTTMSDFICLCNETAERKKSESIVNKKKADILKKNKKLTLQKKKIREINENLEEKIRERTTALEKRNKQLEEYAFINSHLLRAPLSRVLGLVNIFEHDFNAINNKIFITHLKKSASEMDEQIQKITSIIEGDEFSNILN